VRLRLLLLWLRTALLVVLAIVGVVITFWLGDRINMIHAVDESILYARIQALGLLAWRMIDVQARVRMQSRQATRKPLLSLPRAQGTSTFVTRAALSYIRHPFMLLTCFIWGAALTGLGVEIIVRQLPAQVWILWVVVVGVAPPFGLLHVFRSDSQELFLRQFLPVDGLQLLLADILVPLVAMIAGGFTADLWFVISGAGLVATPSPGSIFAYLAVIPPGQHFQVLTGVLIGAVVSFLVGSFILRVNPVREEESEETSVPVGAVPGLGTS